MDPSSIITQVAPPGGTPDLPAPVQSSSASTSSGAAGSGTYANSTSGQHNSENDAAAAAAHLSNSQKGTSAANEFASIMSRLAQLHMCVAGI